MYLHRQLLREVNSHQIHAEFGDGAPCYVTQLRYLHIPLNLNVPSCYVAYTFSHTICSVALH